MAQAASAGKTGRTGGWSDRRIKILATIVVPLVVAVIGLFKFSGGSGEKQTTNNLILVTDVTVIENQYQQITGQPFKDDNLKQLIQSAVNLAKAGQSDASLKLFQEVANRAPVPAVYNNIGALSAEKGDYRSSREAIQQALAKDPNYKPAQENLKQLVRLEKPTITQVKDQEAEPNNDFNHANLMPINQKIAGEISDRDDTDFFQFKTPKGARDVYQASLENGSMTLHPGLTIYDENRHSLNSCSVNEALAHFECQFSADADSTYYVQVFGYISTTGAYFMLVKPLGLADRYEPNDDFTQAKPISIGSTIEANIMDRSDTDFYIVKAGATAAKLTATIENGSTTLNPSLNIYDANRHNLATCPSSEPLAHLECSFSTTPDSSYFVQVAGAYNTAGAYKLLVK